LIEVINLTKKYGNQKAVDNISFKVEKGEILGFLGPNGAGKSTTMNMITGYLSANEGSIKVDGYDVLENPNEVKKRIGYLPEQPPLYMDMTVREYLNFVCDLKKVKENREIHVNRIASLVKIQDVIGRKIQNLSKGYKQRVGLAQALVGDPEVLILDEPTVGLDPQQIIEIRNVIKGLGKNRTIILSSHILPEISAICERVLIINKGVLVAEGSPEELSQHLSKSRKVMVRIAGDESKISLVLGKISGIEKLTKLGSKEAGTFDYIIEVDESTDIRYPLFDEIVKGDLKLLMSKPMDTTLEEIFMKAIKDDVRIDNGPTTSEDEKININESVPEIGIDSEGTNESDVNGEVEE